MRQHVFTAADKSFTLSDIPENAKPEKINEVISLITPIIEQDIESFSDVQSLTYRNLVGQFQLDVQ